MDGCGSRRAAKLLPLVLAFAFLSTTACLTPASAQTLQELREMSIDDLAKVGVTSVGKTAQSLGDAPASIYVISREDIVRSGASTLPDILQLAPNLQVYERAPGSWIVAARGLNGNSSAQNYANKLLVVIDGRTVYTPLFSGVYWDLPDVLPNDIDRIEVISGPGATLWGANAMNGVINVITRRASDSTGVYAGFRAGSNQRNAALRIGGFLTDTLSLRANMRWLEQDAARLANGVDANDGYDRLGGGFRLDWAPSVEDALTLQGEVFGGNLHMPLSASEETGGRSLVLRWNHGTAPGNELQAQLFYDRIERATQPGGGGFFVDTWDAEFQHGFALGERHRLLWGGGARLASYRIDGTPSFFFVPPQRDLFLANAFVQDTFTITPRLTLTAGLKLENDPYVGTSLLPEFRFAWKPATTTLIWGAVSRAVRSPTPFDVDVEERAGAITLSGNRDFRTEKLTAFELGFRIQPAPTFSLSINGYFNRYDDLRSVEFVPGPGLTLVWANGLEGDSHGIDAWADWRPTDWWTLSGGASWLEQDFQFKSGATGILGTAQLGTDPSHQFKLRSSMNFGAHWKLDANFRAVGALRQSNVKGYRELGGRLAWLISSEVVVSVSASNLLHDYHQEYPDGDMIPRSVTAGVELRF